MFAKHLLCLFLVWNMRGFFCSSSEDSEVSEESNDCNEVVCGSVVSKCLLTKSCQCQLTDCFCCKDCLHCLGELYMECCGCLEMCPNDNYTLSILAPKSQVGDLIGVSQLFNALTADSDDDQWITVRFPMLNSLQRRYNKASGTLGVELPAGDSLLKQALSYRPSLNLLYCTVVYLHTCKTRKKCSQYCQSMGSNSYRWFHDGCCECVGPNCYNYGINENRCTSCPDNNDKGKEGINNSKLDDADSTTEDNTNWDYDEDDPMYN